MHDAVDTLARRIAMLRQICCKVEDLTLNGPRVAPIHHSQSSVTSLRSGERISCLGRQKIEVRGKEERECGRESDQKSRTFFLSYTLSYGGLHCRCFMQLLTLLIRVQCHQLLEMNLFQILIHQSKLNISFKGGL